MRLTPYGRRETTAIAIGGLALAGGLAQLSPWAAAAVVPVVGFGLGFFRDPERAIPGGAGLLVAPADGVVTEVSEVREDRVLGAPAKKFGIFLSVLDVHVNRAPCDGRVEKLEYRKGTFVNAMSTASSSTNESQWIAIRAPGPSGPVVVVRQVAGLLARRIVCALEEGQEVRRGERIGMIKFGSRTELYVPVAAVRDVAVRTGDRARGGETVLARLRT
jgi:phosphatidylserine decarboxylase